MKKLLTAVILICMLMVNGSVLTFANEYEALDVNNDTQNAGLMNEADEVTTEISAEETSPESVEEPITIVLRPENMAYDSAYAKVAADSGVEGYLSGNYIYLHKALTGTEDNTEDYQVKMNVFIPREDTYYVWAITKDFAGNKPGTRWAKLAVDGVKYDYQFNSDGLAQTANGGKTGYRWEMGFSAELSEGKHSVDIVEWKASCRLNAILITSDDTLDPNELDYATQISLHEDINTLPEFAEGDISINNYDAQSVIVNWPQAADSKGLYGYFVQVNDNTPLCVKKDVTEYVISGLKNLDKISVKIEAVDLHGHAVSIEKTGYFSDMEFVSLRLFDESGVGNFKLSDFVDKDELNARFVLLNKSDENKQLLLGVGVYDKSTGVMIGSTRQKFVLSGNAEEIITLSWAVSDDFAKCPENYKVYAAVWDAETSITPQTIGILVE